MIPDFGATLTAAAKARQLQTKGFTIDGARAMLTGNLGSLAGADKLMSSSSATQNNRALADQNAAAMAGMQGFSGQVQGASAAANQNRLNAAQQTQTNAFQTTQDVTATKAKSAEQSFNAVNSLLRG